MRSFLEIFEIPDKTTLSLTLPLSLSLPPSLPLSLSLSHSLSIPSPQTLELCRGDQLTLVQDDLFKLLADCLASPHFQVSLTSIKQRICISMLLSILVRNLFILISLFRSPYQLLFSLFISLLLTLLLFFCAFSEISFALLLI